MSLLITYKSVPLVTFWLSATLIASIQPLTGEVTWISPAAGMTTPCTSTRLA